MQTEITVNVRSNHKSHNVQDALSQNRTGSRCVKRNPLLQHITLTLSGNYMLYVGF